MPREAKKTSLRITLILLFDDGRLSRNMFNDWSTTLWALSLPDKNIVLIGCEDMAIVAEILLFGNLYL